MASVPSPAIRLYRRASGRFAALREALARAGFRGVSPPDPLGAWECVDEAGVRVRGADGLVLVEAPDARAADGFDGRFRLAFPSDGEIPDGGAPPEVVALVAGSDESGKGDRSQALVVAAVLVPCAAEGEALARGVRDSKSCSRDEVDELAGWVRAAFPHEVRVIAAADREAALRAHGGNETRLLAAMHAECLSALRGREPFALARVDRFAEGRPVAGALAGRWADVVVDECVRGERHVAVAAASLVARSLARPAPHPRTRQTP
ncbi:MAG: Ribonuclease [Planctomycetota bacterium]